MVQGVDDWLEKGDDGVNYGYFSTTMKHAKKINEIFRGRLKAAGASSDSDSINLIEQLWLDDSK